MEIRNALQKIENYLTVVSNLNKTILSEGTMSKDELLLMKKYLFTSIDRIEDIERSLIMDKIKDKSFTPTKTTENKFVPTPTKEKEIVEVAQNEHIEEAEAALTDFSAVVAEVSTEEIQADAEQEEMVFVGEIKAADEVLTADTPLVIEIAPLVESIITEDYSLNTLPESKVEDVPMENKLVAEEKSFAESIITEDYTLNKLFENKAELVATTPTIAEPVIEKVTLVESIITEDYSLNKLFETKTEEIIADQKPLLESIITEDYSLSKLVEKIAPVQEMIVVEEKTEMPLVEKVTPQMETLTSKFEDQSVGTFAETLANNKKEEKSLFELYDDGKEELHESFANNKTTFEPVVTTFEKPLTTSSYEEHHDSVLVAEKEVETITIEQLTPSSLNDIFKPQTPTETASVKSTKSLSESIALNDKFIFVRELFGNQFAEYETGLKQLDALNSLEQANNYCKEKLWNKFNWSDKTSAVDRFMALLQKRFN